MTKPYWPASDITPKHGMDYQGRFDARPGLHLVDSSDHGAAHVCSAITSDSDDDGPPREPMSRGELLALLCVFLVSFLATVAGVSVAWSRWLP